MVSRAQFEQAWNAWNAWIEERNLRSPWSVQLETPTQPTAEHCRFHRHGTLRVLDLGTADSHELLRLQHTHDYKPGIWYGHETRRDTQGREWSRSISMVIDDFGTLVEVGA